MFVFTVAIGVGVATFVLSVLLDVFDAASPHAAPRAPITDSAVKCLILFITFQISCRLKRLSCLLSASSRNCLLWNARPYKYLSASNSTEKCLVPDNLSG